MGNKWDKPCKYIYIVLKQDRPRLGRHPGLHGAFLWQGWGDRDWLLPRVQCDGRDYTRRVFLLPEHSSSSKEGPLSVWLWRSFPEREVTQQGTEESDKQLQEALHLQPRRNRPMPAAHELGVKFFPSRSSVRPQSWPAPWSSFWRLLTCAHTQMQYGAAGSRFCLCWCHYAVTENMTYNKHSKTATTVIVITVNTQIVEILTNSI